jgi:2-methylthioadenine synthetase
MTSAQKLEGHISDKIKSQRLDEVLKLQNEITERKNKIYEGTIQEVLVEGKDENGLTIGRTRTNKIVKINCNISSGSIIKVKISKAYRHSLEGEVIQ